MPSPVAKLAAAGSPRKYDIVVLGATGFTGKYICEHLVANVPRDCKWAIAGRSIDSLNNLGSELGRIHSDCAPPAIVRCTLDPGELKQLAQNTRILITAIGPYSKYGTPVVDACIASGTHYFDVTGESPWVYNMINKFESRAKTSKAIIIPQIGVDSAPADLLSWALATHIKRTLGAQTADVIFSLHELVGAPSGGTLGSVFAIFEEFKLSHVQSALRPWSISPIGPTPGSQRQSSLLHRLTGVRTVSDLGVLTTSLQGPIDATEVYRTHGLIDKGDYYGPNFCFQPYMRARNVFLALVMHIGIAIGAALLCISPVRTLLKTVVYQPGQGPTKESSKADRVEYRAIAHADISSMDAEDPKRVLGRLIWEGSLYHLTGVFAAEAAITLLKDETPASAIGGGFLTPALLGEAYLDRLQGAGLKIDVKTLP